MNGQMRFLIIEWVSLVKKGLLLGESQISDVQLIQLVAKVYIRKRAKREMSIDLPFTD